MQFEFGTVAEVTNVNMIIIVKSMEIMVQYVIEKQY